MVDGWSVDAQLDESIVECIFLRLEKRHTSGSTPSSRKPALPTQSRTHQGVKIQQNISFPRGLRLSPRTALRVDGFSKEKEWFVRLAFFILGDGVGTREGLGGRAEAPSEVGRAVVDDNRCVRGAVVVIRFCGGR